MSKGPKADAFLRAMKTEVPEAAAPPVAVQETGSVVEEVRAKGKTAPRSGLKHIGGYFDRDTVEKVAVLRARLGLDNSELLKLAVDELHRKHEAARAFGDA